jgi:hypothetical protein
MGKTPKPLRIIADDRLTSWPELTALILQGHEVIFTRFDIEGEAADLVIGPTCHRMDEPYRKYLSLALAEGRRVKYPKGKTDNVED